MEMLSSGAQRLVRRLPLVDRREFKKEVMEKYARQYNRPLSKTAVIVVVEWTERNEWHNTTHIVEGRCQVGQLSIRFKKMNQASVQFSTAKSRKMITPNRSIKEIYEEFHDPDDGILYLSVLYENAF